MADINWPIGTMAKKKADRSWSIESDFFHLARIALKGDRADAIALVRRAAHRAAQTDRELANRLAGLIEVEHGADPRRGVTPKPIPVDGDSRLQLVRREFPVEMEFEPVWPPSVSQELESVLAEREREDDLARAGLAPTRSLLFTGPPGVGKTLASRWLATQLRRPLITLDLSAVMSSFLGRTGTNLRTVLDYARREPSVLLLDEFDAIAKRRDDASEVGELKRLVTVLLQAIDDWPAASILIAATNHAELLDPAVWRRFDRVVPFPLPSEEDIAQAAKIFAGSAPELDQLSKALALTFAGSTFAELARQLIATRRRSIIGDLELPAALEQMIASVMDSKPAETRRSTATALVEAGYSQRKAHELTGVSRDTIRRRLQEGTTS